MLVVVRGAGDIASGIIHKLFNSGFKVIATEVEKPTSIRREVCFSEAIYDTTVKVDGVQGKLCFGIDDIDQAFHDKVVPIVIDPNMNILTEFNVDVVVDSILAKKNLGTNIEDAKIVIAVGPGFAASIDCDAVIESKRGHDLGRIIYKGSAIDNTGIPGNIDGRSTERVFHSPASGIMKNNVNIGDKVSKNDLIFTVSSQEVHASFDGIIRGIIKDGFSVEKGMKVADIDPRLDQTANCNKVSDKARCIAGGVLEAILQLGGLDE